jgi:hypothetical protein
MQCLSIRPFQRVRLLAVISILSATIWVGCDSGNPAVDVSASKKASAEGGLQLNPAAKGKGAAFKSGRDLPKPKE